MTEGPALVGENEGNVRGDELWDAAELGNILRGARLRRGYDRMADLILDIFRMTGMRWHENTLYDVENGKRLPNLSLLLALMLTLRMRYSEIEEAVSPEYREGFRGLIR